nr:uncharacterized protein CI109_005755 [Kwoniella shandongensis]KAA5525873.1 hypothetical protein CI109_005755 [Kwoniella shandongensis]
MSNSNSGEYTSLLITSDLQFATQLGSQSDFVWEKLPATRDFPSQMQTEISVCCPYQECPSSRANYGSESVHGSNARKVTQVITVRRTEEKGLELWQELSGLVIKCAHCSRAALLENSDYKAQSATESTIQVGRRDLPVPMLARNAAVQFLTKRRQPPDEQDEHDEQPSDGRLPTNTLVALYQDRNMPQGDEYQRQYDDWVEIDTESKRWNPDTGRFAYKKGQLSIFRVPFSYCSDDPDFSEGSDEVDETR